MTNFIEKLKKNGGHILDIIKTVKNDTMIYYRENGSFPTDTKTKVFNN